MSLILAAVFFGLLLGYSTYHTFTKLPMGVQFFLFRHEFLFDAAVTFANLLSQMRELLLRALFSFASTITVSILVKSIRFQS